MKTLKTLMDMRGRVACVTGGAGHIGSTMASALAEMGAEIAIIDLNPSQCEQVAGELEGRWGVRARGIPADLENEKLTRASVAEVLAQFGRMDVLIHAAALVGTSSLEGWSVPFERQSSATWRRALEVNLTAAFVLSQASRDALVHSGHGVIINVLSIYAIAAPAFDLYEGTEMGNPAAYGASKAGLLQLTRYLAAALAPDVRVNAITPGGVSRGQAAAFLSRYESLTPLARMAVEEDFKGVTAFLASDLSKYVTGQNIVVDGGWTI